ncbi:MAG: hypothetical protein R2725_12440 [Solirubrobacterales bacterium]
MRTPEEPRHEALARRRGDGFVATCGCGWYGHDVRDRREATRAALEHEMRAAQKLERMRRIALVEQEETERERPEDEATR